MKTLSNPTKVEELYSQRELKEQWLDQIDLENQESRLPEVLLM